ncbi:MAG TPA: double zinc ribbon domain-containing protein [Blastocatellia bacterium]|nr:double zinc ribbon domain-containing protein [Blastocatellia bacterium]
MLARALNLVRDGLIALAYPQDCRLCGRTVESFNDGVTCDRCWRDSSITKVFTEPLCAKCGLPLPAVSAFAQADDSVSNEGMNSDALSAPAIESRRLCGRCATLPFSAARACGAYSGAIEANVLFLKSHPHLCRRLRMIISETFSAHRTALESDVVVPVPLHRLRQRERGFNQAKIIAQVLSKRFGLPLDEGLLARTRYTEMHRAGVDAIDRAKSVERAFKIERPKAIKGATVLLVDDVYTTGSTICAAATALVGAGAQRVSVLTIARVVPSFIRRRAAVD